MKPKFHLAACLTTLLFTTASSHALTTWIGPDSGGDVFNPDNWDEVGPVNGVIFDDDILIAGAAVASSAGGTLILKSGRMLTLAPSATVPSATLTISSLQGTTGAGEDADTIVNVTNSTINCNNIAFDAVLNLTGTSSLQIFAASPNPSRNTINGDGTAANGTRVNLADGCRVVHNNGNDASNAGAQSVGQRIFRTSSGISFATDFATPPLTDFALVGASAPFATPTTSPFTITAGPPPAPIPGLVGAGPDIVIGFRLVPPETQEAIWYPTFRSSTDWQIDLATANIVRFGWSGITDVYVADLDGDGRDDKVMRQTANNGGNNPSQIIATYSLPGPTGFTTTDFNGSNGDLDIPFGFLSAADTQLTFGDLDGDKIEDAGVYLDASNPNIGGTAGQMVWGTLKSGGVKGISNDFANFVGWNVFGITGDRPFMGDFNGDGVADRMLHRPSSNQVFIDLSVPGNFGDGVADYNVSLGIAGDTVYVSDINGDGFADLVLSRQTDLLPPPNTTPGLKTIFGFYNDKTGFSTLIGSSPNIQDIWGNTEGLLFGRLDGLPPGFRITQVTSAGPGVAFAGNFDAVAAGTYLIQTSLNLQDPWLTLQTIVVATPAITPFSLSKAQLDTAYGAGVRPKVFVRAALQP